MGSADRCKLTVNFDQADQQRRGFQRLLAVRGVGKLVQIVPDPRKLTQQLGGNLGRFAALPQAQTPRLERTSSDSETPLFSAMSCQCRFSSSVVLILIHMGGAFQGVQGQSLPLRLGLVPSAQPGGD